MFSMPRSGCERLDRDEPGEASTRVLRDGNVTSCVPIFNVSYTFILGKVLNPTPGRLVNRVKVRVVGHYLKCSPIGGIRVALEPMLDEEEEAVVCIAYADEHLDGLNACIFNCQFRGNWDYITFTVNQASRVDYNYNSWKICEIYLY